MLYESLTIINRASLFQIRRLNYYKSRRVKEVIEKHTNKCGINQKKKYKEIKSTNDTYQQY